MFSFAIKIRRQRMILALVQNALVTETPIHEVLYAYANTCWGLWYRAKLIRFADKIQRGCSIVETAASIKGIFRYETIGLIKLGGTKLPDQLLAQTTGEIEQNGMAQEQAVFQFFWYYVYFPFLIPPVFLQLIVNVPQMQAIFNDFGMELPFITTFVTNVSQTIGEYSYIFLPLFVILFFVPIFYFNFRSGILPWRPLGVRRMLRQRDSAQFLRLFAAGLELKKPIEEIIAVYAQVVPSHYLCRLGKRFNEQIAKGASWIESLRKMRWLSSGEAALLESAVRTDCVEAMLREIAGGKEQSQRTADNTIVQIFSVLCLTMFGIFAALFAIASFTPLISLITALTN